MALEGYVSIIQSERQRHVPSYRPNAAAYIARK